MYTVVFTKQADKTLKRLPRQTAKLIAEKIQLLAEDPYQPNPNVTKLQNREGYRLRMGDWRIIYEIINNELVIVVLKIGPRGSVYE